jgi:hypothetical protein
MTLEEVKRRLAAWLATTANADGTTLEGGFDEYAATLTELGKPFHLGEITRGEDEVRWAYLLSKSGVDLFYADPAKGELASAEVVRCSLGPLRGARCAWREAFWLLAAPAAGKSWAKVFCRRRREQRKSPAAAGLSQ